MHLTKLEVTPFTSPVSEMRTLKTLPSHMKGTYVAFLLVVYLVLLVVDLVLLVVDLAASQTDC